MYISSIKLKNFRGYYSSNISFVKGMNVFVGKNASGKTNLLEAIHYLSFTKSFRGVEDKELIKYGAKEAVINAVIKTTNKETDLDILISETGKKILVNDKAINKLSALNDITNVIIFKPNDVNLFTGSPKDRRNYLDTNISKLNPLYNGSMSRFDKLLKERNEILKLDKIDKEHLLIITKQMIDEEKKIIEMRKKFVTKINDVLSKVVKKIKNEKDEAKIIYFPYVDIDENYQSKALKLYEDNLENDIKRKASNIGIHREDFVLYLNRKNIAINGSQGENRILAIAVKLSPYFLVKDKEQHPIVALDDVMSELDLNHQRKLIGFLRKLDQVFITTTNLKIDNTSIYEIDNHQIIRRNK